MRRVHRIELLAVIGLVLAVGCRSADVTASTRQKSNPQYTPAGQAAQPTPPPTVAAVPGAEADRAGQPTPQPPAEAVGEGAAGPQPVVPAGQQAKLQFYIMSHCPFGVEVLNGVIPALRQIGPWVDFKLDFIGGIEGDKLTSMHGESEVAGDIVELCTILHAPTKWLDLFSCWNQEVGAFPGNWRTCATQSQLDAPTVDLIAACSDGPDGKALLKASFEKAQQSGATGSPTIMLNGAPWQGGRDERAFLSGICNALGEPKPAVCAAIPPPPKVNLLVIGDQRCKNPECRTADLIGQLKGLFSGLVVTELDWGTPEGKAAYAEHGLQFLPAYIFDDTVQADAAGSQRVRRYLQPTAKPGFQQLQMGARHDPNAEICDNAVDDTGDGKVDCDDPTCKEVLVCRPEIKGSLQVFVMSQCPYGVQALDAMREVLTAFGSDITFDVHYIADASGDGFQSMHGQGEVDEDIRELCAKKLYRDGNKFMDYIWCRNKDIRNAAWQGCATEAGMDVAALETCSTGDQGRQLLREDAALGRALGFNSSPTWLVDNKRQAGGFDPRTIQQAICQGSPQFQGCSATLTGPAPRPQGAGGGCGG
ncbi:MAG: hypothetical protein HY905_15025 [Deltaproteobacteria bacterium]|nr:hypothetical protein [Deltaproteobacteria bacterium]